MFTDALELGKPRRTSEGYLAVRAKAARAGVYDYLGAEVDPTGERFKATDTVKVYRPESEVFAKASVNSFLMRPITNDHPSEAVNATNWKKHAKGVNAGAMRDGEYLAFDLIVMDESTINDIEGDKKQLSNGYSADLVFGDGITPDGIAYQATQTNIRGNHVAVVKAGRAGAECRIADTVAICDKLPEIANFIGEKTVATKTIVFDGISIEVTDQAAQAIEKLQGTIAGHAKELATRDAALAKAEAERDDAKTKILSDADLDQRVAARSELIAAATALVDGLDVKGKTEAQIKREVVSKHVTDAASKSDAYIDARFDILVEDGKKADPFADQMRKGATAPALTLDQISMKSAQDMNAWRNVN
jgi:uncharacterized protein